MPDLATGCVEGNVRSIAANFARIRKDVEYSLNAPAATGEGEEAAQGRHRGILVSKPAEKIERLISPTLTFSFGVRREFRVG